MKNRIMSQTIEMEQERLLQEMKQRLQNKYGTGRSFLSNVLANLINAYLHYDQYWPHRERWIDDTGFLSVKISGHDTLRIIGYINLSDAKHNGNITKEPMEAELRLHGRNGRQKVSYSIKFCCNGYVRHISADGIYSMLVNKRGAAKLDANNFLGILNDVRNDGQTRILAALLLAKMGVAAQEMLTDEMAVLDSDTLLIMLQAAMLPGFPINDLAHHIVKALSHSVLKIRVFASVAVYAMAQKDHNYLDHLKGAIKELTIAKTISDSEATFAVTMRQLAIEALKLCGNNFEQQPTTQVTAQTNSVTAIAIAV